MTACYVCGKQLTKNEVGLTKKLIDEHAKKYYCLSCLADELEVTEEDLREKIEDYKNEGCPLFQ